MARVVRFIINNFYVSGYPIREKVKDTGSEITLTLVSKQVALALCSLFLHLSHKQNNNDDNCT